MRSTVALSLSLALTACSPSPGEPDAAIGPDTTVAAFDGEHIYFGDENRRTVDVEVAFPDAALDYERVTLQFALRCPNDRCDWWDRLGRLSLVASPGAEDEGEVELVRFITPYRVGGSWSIDVTSLRPLLVGTVTLRVFIDTWVGPGHANGDGWLVDASFEMVGGEPHPRPFAVIPVWSPRSVTYGDPAEPIDVTAALAIPDGVLGARLRTIVTGHGQGNADNCAEFCPRDHTVTLGGADHTAHIWRDDCQQTAVPGQQGTWTYPRAGWCPGAIVEPWTVTVSDQVIGAATVDARYGVESYENSCRPDATECTGCLAGGCDYDGGAHTPPIYALSSLLILYR